MLHLRPGRAGMSPLIEEALRILRQERLGSEHPIHFHTFTGAHSDYKAWIRQQPKTIFGVSMRTILTPTCKSFAKLADLRKVVLESDAPHLKTKGQDNSPYCLKRQADWLATLRGLPTRAIHFPQTLVLHSDSLWDELSLCMCHITSGN